MTYRIEFSDDLMMVLDEEDRGHDAFDVHPDELKEAERKIDEWVGQFKLDAEAAKRELWELVRQM